MKTKQPPGARDARFSPSPLRPESLALPCGAGQREVAFVPDAYIV